MSRFRDIMRKSEFYPQEPEPVKSFSGEFNLQELQEDLNDMDCDSRVLALAENEKLNIFNRLEVLRKSGQKEDAFALFAENLEFISPSHIEHEDHYLPYWHSSSHLKYLRLAQTISRYYENKNNK